MLRRELFVICEVTEVDDTVNGKDGEYYNGGDTFKLMAY